MKYFKFSNFKFFGLAALLLMSACAGKNIHKELKDDPNILLRKWTIPTRDKAQGLDLGERGYDFSNPVFFENTLIFGNRSVGLISIYPKINQQRWQLNVRNGVLSEIAVDGGAVYFGGGDGFFYSVDAESGRVNWRYEIHNPIVSQAVISGGRVFVTTTDDTVFALDAGTGKWLWNYRRRSSPSSTILGSSSPLVDGAEVIVGLSDGFLVALSINDGQLKWERKLHMGNKFTDVDAHPVLENGIIYVPSYDGSLYALKRASGEVIWKMDSGGSKRVSLTEDRIYMPSSDGTIYCLSKTGGKVIWQFEMDGGTPTQLLINDRYVIVGSSFQYLYVLDKETGKGKYRFNVGNGSGFYGAPVFDPAMKNVYILSTAGNLYDFEVRKGPHKIYSHGMSQPFNPGLSF